ncbi:tat (twin-arginine translocation) pathway signal sequence domain protein [Mycolicibacterium hassiacum DSM 44199]|jgi:spermidine/putrescine transport system substrate-binding protein|uniref:Tat (Twin-arginine translocation) pathway signal sequence domain protein n=1 Tax=Mycolicibacterium hassiacum (strain DSM 44199 / CIP 105218 / JCM 12690 / 3849) TaxID=1122247 RepID=K5B8H3_MYCHD|nr:spermidine/putrescine ABC transporter substrate-binding protein [Mycolicibacterium hassiacum]EKF23698.1 tat (twin-arginine translocation) pathway signal sequence domain protein [Mycolicibacterium hassiacum DSM 44199]MBX5486823.1 spermidine/putrescine ABC transporter substrate-binding protein [Mycolicibacterium hassiacum]MDA4085955.1 twin-arginine translocation pathway signal protein [Mycolicibacterium hassiacum DSM 44199]PZN18393.1 MAG: spermidine/putrescine ABC transporter substrate-binding
MPSRNPGDLDPRLLARFAANRTSRRRFLGGGAAAVAALALGPSVLAACGTEQGGSPSGATAPPDDGSPASGELRISNWPLYMADGFIAAFQTASGITVDYKEDFNDNEEWFAKVKEPLSRKQDIGADLVVPTEFMAVRLNNLGWLNEIRESRIPNKKNLRPDLLNSPADPGRKVTAPYMSGMVGLAYNKAATGRPITKIEDLWDPAFKGRVALLSDIQDGLGMIMLSQGNSPENPTTETVQKAVDLVREQKERGQIRRFAGNDYATDLASGNVVITQAYSGDVVQLQADNPDLEFVVPESGGTWFIDTMVIPYTTRNQAAAEAWMDYVYDRANYAELVAAVQFVPVLADIDDELHRVSPEAANNPLINPPQSVLDRIKSWPALTDEQTQEYNTIYAEVTGG